MLRNNQFWSFCVGEMRQSIGWLSQMRPRLLRNKNDVIFTFWGDGDLEPDNDPMSTPDDDSHEFEFQSSSHESGELILSDLKNLIK